MKINKVDISKFRSIEKGVFNFNNITAVVGQNNSGKSAIMRALNSFFNPKVELHSYIDETNLYTTKRTIPRIIITFSNIPNNVHYTPHIVNLEMTIKQEYNKTRKRLDYFVLSNGGYQVMSDEFVNQIHSDIQFVLIPTERGVKYEDHEEFSVLKKLLNTYFSVHTARRDTLSPKVQQAFNYLKNNALKKVSKGVEDKYLAKRGFKIEIDSKYPINYELFLNDLAIKIIEENKSFYLSECGSGIQSLVAISIYRYLAGFNNTNFIIGIEEPEINLHPQAQKELIFALLEEVGNTGLQLIFTTHSTVLIDELDHTRIVLVRKDNDVNRSFKSTIHQIDSNFWTKYNLQVLQYDKFHKYRNSEFFYANHVMITESPTDSEVFRNLLKSKNIIIEKHGISILELSGITSLKYAYYLLKELDIPKTMIIDKDFFFNYQYGSKANSRYGSGFFNYSTHFNDDPLIIEIFDDVNELIQIEQLLTTNHSQALDHTLKFDVLCMKYNMEMDLVASNTACNLIYNRLNIAQADRNTNFLLTNHEGSLKKLDLLLYVINNLRHQNLPNSYKRLIRRFREMIN